MNPQSFLELIESNQYEWANTTNRPGQNRFDIDVADGRLLDAVAAVTGLCDCYLVAITGLDPGVESGQLWVLYHFAHRAEVATLRIILPREMPIVPTISHRLPSASIFEQELGEVLGVLFVEPGTDDPVYHSRLFIADDWPEDVYPLRKDFHGLSEPA
jgi:Ni,Fe-hydrogenase III component G